MATQFGFNKIVTDGLVLSLDAADRNSYVSGSLVWNDVSGNGNNGSLINGPTFNSGSGGNIVFDGVNDYVDGSVINLQSQITVLVFVKPMQRIGTNYPIYIAKWEVNPSNNRSWFLGSDTIVDKEIIAISTNGAYDANSVKRYEISNVNYGTWRQIGFTFNSGILTPYKNGIPVSYFPAIDANITTIYTSNISYKLGTSIDGLFDLNLSGSISTIQIYNRALSASEVLQNYNAQKSRFGLK